MRSSGVRAAWLACVALAGPLVATEAAAQRYAPVGARPVDAAPPEPLVALPAAVRGSDEGTAQTERRAPVWAPAASLIVPGAGQAALRQARGVAYLAAEVYVLLQYREFARDARSRREDYRRTAREVARARFGGTADGPWEYYEAMYDTTESGRYNLTPGAALTPETDLDTYNGLKWFLIRRLYFLDPDAPPARSDPKYQQALAAYEATAIKDGFLWSWRGQQLQWQLYKDAINRENQLTRYVNTTLNVLIANHLLSAIDALTSVRLRQTAGPGGERRYEATIPWAPFGRRPPRRP